MARSLLGDDGTLVLAAALAFSKDAGCRHGSPWHVDRPEPNVAHERTCNAWIALDDGGPESGTIQLIADSQHWDDGSCAAALCRGVDEESMEVDDVPTFAGIPGLVVPPAGPPLCFTLERGDAVCFDSRMVHGAHGNRSASRFLSMSTMWWAGEVEALGESVTVPPSDGPWAPGPNVIRSGP